MRGLFTLLAAFVIIGCSIGDFVGAYFNTYYNARRLFEEAEEEIWSQPDTRQTGQNYLLLVNAPPNAKTKLTSVIEKCSKLLQYHPESSLVDESLLMIGKSYFYQSEYQKAERKFKELIEGTGGDLVPEARMLLAYTYYKMGNRDSARTEAVEVAALGDDLDEEVRSRVALLLGRIEQDNGNYEQARLMYQGAAESAPNSELRSTAWLRAGDMLALVGDFADAGLTYQRAYAAGSTYIAEYRGALGAARMLKRQGKFGDALDALSELRENNNYREFFGEVDLETAAVLDTMGNIRDALTQYALVDTSYARTEIAARSYYRRGLLFEMRLGMYDSARVAYNKGRGEYPQADVAPDLNRRADALNRYQRLADEIAKSDSMRAALLAGPVAATPDSAASDSVGTDSLAVRERQTGPPPVPLDTVMYRLARDMTELGGLFFTSLQRPDSALYWFGRVVREHPSSPFAPRAIYTLAQLAEQDSTVPRARVDSLYREVLQRFPGSEFAAEARRIVGLPPVPVKRHEAEALYAEAERLLGQGKGEAALDRMRQIVHDYPASPQAPRAQYAIGWIFEYMIDQPDSALAHYKRLVEAYPSSPFAAKAQARIPAPAPPAQIRPSAPPDTSDQTGNEERRPAGQRQQRVPGQQPGARVPPDTLNSRRE